MKTGGSIKTGGSVFVLALLASVVTVCATSGHSPDTYSFSNTERIEIKPVHEIVYRDMAYCIAPINPAVTLGEIRFYRVDELIWWPRKNQQIALDGLSHYPSRTIFLRRGEEHGPTLAHEMLHLMLPHASHWHPVFRRCDPLPPPIMSERVRS